MLRRLDVLGVGTGRNSGEQSASSVVDSPRSRTPGTATRWGGVGGVEGRRKPASGLRRWRLVLLLTLGLALPAGGCKVVYWIVATNADAGPEPATSGSRFDPHVIAVY